MSDLDVSGLEKIERMMKGKMPSIKVGIMGDGAARDEATNAEVGVAHEFGTENLPQRSFLRMPLNLKMNEYLENSGILDENVFAKAIKEGGVFTIAKKLGIMGETIVLDAFDTGGFGEWEPSDFSNKKVHQTLVETQQLRDSITNRVEK